MNHCFGQFAPTGDAYVIHDAATPMPWVNVIANPCFGLVVSQRGGGFTWIDNSQLSVLTRWDMDLARDAAGKFLYLSEPERGAVWSLAPSPCRPAYDEYRCTHEQGATTFFTRFDRIEATWTLGVAPDDPAEIWTVELVNRTNRPRRLRLATYLEWCCGVAPDVKREFHRLFITTSHDEVRNAILATKNLWDVPPRHEGEHWNRPWPYTAAHAGVGFDRPLRVAAADKRLFLGRYGDLARPEGMLSPRPPTGGFGRFADAAASMGGEFVLDAAQTRRVAFVLAAERDAAAVRELIGRYNTVESAAAAIARSRAGWSTRLASTQVSTAAPDFNALNNTWLPYQAISGRLWGRTGYYQQSGAFGFRDQLQDSHVWLPREPSRTRDQLLLHAAHQFADGSVYHWWHPLTDTGLHTACSDDYLWLPFVTVSYLKETGDWSILDAHAPFVDDAAGASLLEHCLRAFRRAFTRHSARGLPLIGSCDWNDGLSAVGVAGRGESVWLAFFLAGLLADFSHVLEHLGDDEAAADFTARRERLVAAVNALAWDGRWFRRATKDDGEWIGASACREGRIYLNAQTWAILADATDEPRKRAAWESLKEHLFTEYGPLLLAPAYTEPDPTIGYITRYAPGCRENGGVYMHAATWCLAAACERGDRDAVARLWRSISPPRRSASDPEAYAAEPYVMPGNADGPLSEMPGRAGWTWYTGSAAWLNKVCLERVLGVRPTWDGLLIDPCPPVELGRVTVRRVWRGREVRVSFDAAAWRTGESVRLTVRGQPIAGTVIPESALAEEGATEIEAAWGPADVPQVRAERMSRRTVT